MTKKIARALFLVYQGIFASANAACRFRPTCSQYVLEAIEKYGFIKGMWLATKRILSCHPFSKRPLYDPVT